MQLKNTRLLFTFLFNLTYNKSYKIYKNQEECPMIHFILAVIKGTFYLLKKGIYLIIILVVGFCLIKAFMWANTTFHLLDISNKTTVASNAYAIDGDTIHATIDGENKTIRMLLIDTPETVHPSKGIQPFGKVASDFTKQQIKKAKKVELEFVKSSDKVDKYNRLLAHVFVDGKNLQAELIKNGYARVGYIYNNKDPYITEYKKLEKSAKQQQIGIWSIEGYVTKNGYNFP